jgi:inner membrane protein involved in colicin E2 resistance
VSSGRLPPLLERTLRDDVKWGAFVLLGATFAFVVFGADEPTLLVGAFLGVVAVIAVMAVVRRVRPRRGP